MFWFILFFSLIFVADVSIIVRTWGWWRTESDWLDIAFLIFISVVLTVAAVILSGLLAVGIATWIGSMSDQVWEKGWHGKLASLRNSDGIQGSFAGGMFLMAGGVGSTEMYYYYEDKGDGKYKPHKWSVDQYTTVYEEDRKDGEVQQFETSFKHQWVSAFAFPPNDYRMDFHIPKGSLVQQYSLK